MPTMLPNRYDEGTEELMDASPEFPSEPCVYGHIGCAFKPGGRCTDEYPQDTCDHAWVESEESGRTYCLYCQADGDA